jgi:hypothetical protein
MHVVVCRACGGELWVGQTLEPDEDWAGVEALSEDELAEAGPDRAVMWREEQFLRLGFSVPQAEGLAVAVDGNDVPLYHADVAALLARASATRTHEDACAAVFLALR